MKTAEIGKIPYHVNRLERVDRLDIWERLSYTIETIYGNLAAETRADNHGKQLLGFDWLEKFDCVLKADDRSTSGGAKMPDLQKCWKTFRNYFSRQLNIGLFSLSE